MKRVPAAIIRYVTSLRGRLAIILTAGMTAAAIARWSRPNNSVGTSSSVFVPTGSH